MLITRETVAQYMGRRDVSWWLCRRCGIGDATPRQFRSLEVEREQATSHEVSCPGRLLATSSTHPSNPAVQP
ncbi:hypothetical protein Kisp02_54410 [Kineosporia sp. NBRC 101731]|nr:hypothetical protein Kisp02_54410 [Kineosporia sp. NBRC 101731]